MRFCSHYRRFSGSSIFLWDERFPSPQDGWIIPLPTANMKHLAILGATGSIGRNTLEVAALFPDRYAVKALAAKANIELLAEQVARFRPEVVSVFDEDTARALRRMMPADADATILFGDEGYEAVATHDTVHTVVSAMVGAAGLKPTLAAIEAGKEIALANKETLVMAGEVVMGLAKEKGVAIYPVDSEHSAIFQCLAGNRREDLAKILLTASGGPFRERPRDTFRAITPADALNHPTWEMGPKISIDSATMMNKGLEVIEAKFLFDVPEDRIEVVIHPQSLVHSMVSYRDGTVIAQMGPADMKGAIAYALSYPERLPIGAPLLDFAAIGELVFRKPDMEKFPCLTLAYRACRAGGSLPAVLNAANEMAVEAFLDGRLSFADIPHVIDRTMQQHRIDKRPSLSDIIKADQWGRQTAAELITIAANG